jgi:hypothetical protein
VRACRTRSAVVRYKPCRLIHSSTGRTAFVTPLRWQRLYEAALGEKNPSRLKARLRAAEIAMTKAAEKGLNSRGALSSEAYEELMVAMRILYEHALSRGVKMQV